MANAKKCDRCGEFYEKAKKSNGLIKNPVAWALYQAWRRADDKSWKEGERNETY